MKTVHGELWYTAMNGRVDHINRADPRISITDEALHILTDQSPDADTGFKLVGRRDNRPGECWYPIAGHHAPHTCMPIGREPDFCFTGCQLIVEPTHGDKLIYMIGEYDWCDNAWHAAWPD